MFTFDDYDAWGESVSGASLQLACAGVEHRRWTLARVDLGGVVLQAATEGGGTICYGGNAHPGTLVFVPLTEARAHVVNGTPLDDESVFVIPRGADFRIHVLRRAHAWCSIALPGDTVAQGPSGRIPCEAAAVRRLRKLVPDICASLDERPAGTAAHRSAARDVLAAASACVTPEPGPAPQIGRPRIERADVVRRAMALIEASSVMPAAAELADHVGVTGRTLLRTFQESFGVSPKRFLMLRELHRVRRGLRDCSPDDTVADVLVRHGIWEFGRFAARYRRHFGELPSQTLRVARG